MQYKIKKISVYCVPMQTVNTIDATGNSHAIGQLGVYTAPTQFIEQADVSSNAIKTWNDFINRPGAKWHMANRAIGKSFIPLVPILSAPTTSTALGSSIFNFKRMGWRNIQSSTGQLSGDRVGTAVFVYNFPNNPAKTGKSHPTSKQI